ncbi:MAG: UDP-2,3-diacylglucosamine hydrolase [Bacteroidia bacterium]
MSYCCFISDLHLTPARPEITRALDNFLSEHRSSDALYILGDLFETWVGDDDNDALANQVRSLLQTFTLAGPAVHILHGNRDFLLAQRFCTDTGTNLLAEGGVIDLYGTPTLLLHGDTLCTDDRDYQALRHDLRQPLWQANFLQQSLAERRDQAAQLRNLSQAALAHKAEAITDVNAKAVDLAMAQHGVAQLIHGHTHRPGRHTNALGERLVLGDWDLQGWWVKAESNNIQLLNFDIDQ